ncbi:nucleotide-binding universal stress UspA family protein [Kribbella sp. VKM Ac-2500]|uniref:universal stress protein n=1 Tax=Kribbella sp. VKM Ac-2500 TaxID=2512214 RepID=UPI0010F2DCA7|nr:universal stress protein [Kribbella sp. VKM Ac-2500]TCN34439.1 nucleotide-binding universal stress UspA family protein [Kribbella sp. VKM Ac-2500]
MTMKDYRTIVVGTDGSELAEPVVARAAWLAVRDDADLVVVCAFAELSRRTEAMNVATLGGDTRTGQVLGREAAAVALDKAMAIARAEGATVSAALLVDGEPSKVLIATAEERAADLVVLGAIHDRSLADRLLGTVATEVTKRATCDVLVVRPTDDKGDLEVPEDAP